MHTQVKQLGGNTLLDLFHCFVIYGHALPLVAIFGVVCISWGSHPRLTKVAMTRFQEILNHGRQQVAQLLPF